MMCFAWNPKTPCWDAGTKAGIRNGNNENSCPTVGWFWITLAGAALLRMGSKKKRA